MKLDLNSINLDWARNVYEDLKNKHLLPVAALLVVALVAVPFVLGRSSEPVPPATVVASQEPADVKLDPIAVKDSRPNGQDVGGTPSNPFAQPAQPKAAEPAASAPAGSSTGDSSGSSGGSSGSTDKPAPKTSGDPSTAYKIDIMFGATGATKSRKNVAALTPFPSADDAYIVYLGAIDSGKTAVFLISTDVKATGDGICDPSESSCKTVEMQVGDTELFQVEDTAGTTAFAEYELKLVKIHK